MTVTGVQARARKDHFSLYPGKKNRAGEAIAPGRRANPGLYRLQDLVCRWYGLIKLSGKQGGKRSGEWRK
jgi:hypothetical protein